jgi:multiple antibiotic resistance protein
MIVIATGWSMLTQKENNDRDTMGRTVACKDALHDAFYPLTLPLTVGPGSISVAITLGANEQHTLGANLLLAAVIGSAVVAVTIYLCYAFADRLALLVGPTGTNVIVKLTSFLLVCIGVQIVWNGVSQLLRSLPHF